MNNNYIIRQEEEKDYRTVENLTREAFWNQNFPGCNEHYLVNFIRKQADFIPELDFVIEADGEIIGNVVYTKSRLVDENGEKKDILTFGPLSIHPDYQRKGYSRVLLEHSFEKAVELGYDAVVIFGNPDNYVSRGFRSCKKYNVCLEGDIFPTALLVKELTPNTLDGRKWVFYESPAFELIKDEDAEKFDTLFPPKEKKWMPSQEEFYIHSHSVISW